MSIRFDNVGFTYPGSTAGIFDISLEIGQGELVAVIGASGSGKTTLLKLLAGFLTPSKGRIFINDQDVTQTPPRKRDLGLVFQSYALFQHMNVWKNVAYPLKVRGLKPELRKQRAFQALSMVNLQGLEERMPCTLSGGQQQRVALARALVFEPRGLLLDEPLSALDASLRANMRDEITRVQKQADIAALHVTHDQEEALSMASRVAVMENGRLVQIATPRELYDAPSTCSVASFVGQANIWRGRITERDTVRCDIGDLQCDTGDQALGQEVHVLVRPERVRPLSGVEARTAENVKFGPLIRDRFLGAVRRYDIQVDGTKSVIQGETNFRGDIGFVSIPSEAIRLLPKS